MIIIQSNIRSLKGKYDEFSAYLIQKKIDVALVNETWLTEEDEETYLSNLSNYNFFMKYSSTKPGHRGVGIFTKKSLKIEQTDLNEDLDKIEIVAVKLVDEDLFFISIYIPEEPNTIIRSDLAKIENFLENKKFLLGGDFNSHHTAWGSNTSNERGKIIHEFVCNNFLNILNNGDITRMASGKNNGSAIDVTITNSTTQNFTWEVTNDNLGSDHLIIMMKMRLKKAKKISTENHIRRVKNQSAIQMNMNNLMKSTSELSEVQKKNERCDKK